MAERARFDIVFTPHPAIVARGFFMAAERIKDMEQPIRAAAEIVSEQIRQNFDAEGRPTRWEGLKESTVRRKASEGLDPRILRATQALVDGLTEAGQSGLGSWDIEQEGQEWVGTLADPTGYGWRHLEEHRFMPIRDWTYVPDDAYDEIEQEFLEWLEGEFEASGIAG